MLTSQYHSSGDWGCRIDRLDLYSGVRSRNECPGYDIKHSDGDVPALVILGKYSTPSLPLLPCQLWLGVVTPDIGPIYRSNRTV